MNRPSYSLASHGLLGLETGFVDCLDLIVSRICFRFPFANGVENQRGGWWYREILMRVDF